ncbi:MAG: sigma-70 family RNA polymerase sigma factor [Planctomycetota bacterium]
MDTAATQLQKTLGRKPKSGEIADFMGKKEDRVESVLKTPRCFVTLDTPFVSDKSDDEAFSVVENLEDRARKQPHDEIIEESLKENINKALETLNPRDAEIIRHRFGLEGRISLSLKGLAEKYGLSRERIRQIEKRAIDFLRSSDKRRYLEGYLN